MKTTVIEDDIKAFRTEGEMKDIPQHELQVRSSRSIAGNAGESAGARQRERLIIEADRRIALAREEDGMSSLAAADIENASGRFFFLKLLQEPDNRGGGSFHGPAMFAGPVSLLKIFFLGGIDAHDRPDEHARALHGSLSLTM